MTCKPDYSNFGPRRSFPGVSFFFSLLLATRAAAECMGNAQPPYFTSADGALRVIVTSDPAYTQRVQPSSANTRTVLLDAKAEFPQWTHAGHVLNSGETVLIAAWCGPMGLENTGVAVYDPAGKLIWKKSIDELLPDQPSLFARGIDASSWYSEQKLISPESLGTATLIFSLISEDTMTVKVASGAVGLEKVSTTSLLHDSDKAVARAYYYTRVGMPAEALDILKTVHKQHPENLRYGKQLASAYLVGRQFEDAMRVYETTSSFYPEDARLPGETSEAFYGDSPMTFRYDHADVLLRHGHTVRAHKILSSLYETKSSTIGVVVGYAQALFKMEEHAQALEIIDEYMGSEYTKVSEQRFYLSSFQRETARFAQVLNDAGYDEKASYYMKKAEELEKGDQNPY